MSTSIKKPKGVRIKSFKVIRDTTGLWRVGLEGGGELPAKLEGLFTREAEALSAMKVFENGEANLN